MSVQLTQEELERLNQDAAKVRQIVDLISGSEIEEVLGGTIEVLDAVLLLRLVEAETTGDLLPGVGEPGEPGVSDEATAIRALQDLLRGNLRRFDINKQAEANTPIFEENITVENPGAAIRVTVALDTDTTISHTVAFEGESTTDTLNEGNTLGIGNIFSFVIGDHPEGAGVNFETGAAATANRIAVSELPASIA